MDVFPVPDLSMVPQYVSATRMHVADVIANYPPNATRRGMLATVDDLFGALDGTLRCGYDGQRYFWQPSGLPEYFSPMTVASDLTLTALSHPTIIPLSGTVAVGVTRKITLSTDNVWPGARKRINVGGVTSLLGTLQLLSGATSLLNIVLGNTYDMAVDYSGGTPQWVRI